MAVDSRRGASGLRPECLSFPEILAQSIGGIAPTAMPAVTMPLVFANAGKGTWLAYVVATIGLVLVSLNINQFARRSASSAGLYDYIARGLGPTAGVLSGWVLVLAYLGTGMTVICGFVIYADIVLGSFSFHVYPIFLYALCAGVVWFYAYTDIQLSAVIMLIFELTSVSFVLLLAALVLFNHGFTIDTSQILLRGVSFEGIRSGLVLAVFGYTLFESSTTLGVEAKRPLRFIPQSIVWSTVLSGLFYILLSYTEVLGFSGYKTSLAQSDAPLSVLAEIAGVSWLGILLSVGVTFSFFTCTLACVNAGARICFAMARHGIIHPSVGQAHRRNETPHIAVTLSALIVFLVPTCMSLLRIPLLDIYGYLGTVTTYAFLFVYILVSIAAPVYLYRMGRLRAGHVTTSSLAVLFMLVPVVGSVYPVPPAPYSLFPYLFLIYLAAGGGWFLMLRRRSPQIIEDMERALEAAHGTSGPKVG